MSQPLEPNLGRADDGIPAADAGRGAPETAPGFGIGGEDPDQPEETSADIGGDHADPPDDPPDRTPDPHDL